MSVETVFRREFPVAEAAESVADVARRMRDRGVPALVVLDEGRRPVGVVSDRDLALCVLAAGEDPVRTPVRRVMRSVPRSVLRDAPLEMALAAMRAGPYRCLPIVDREGRFAGVLTAEDVLASLAEELLGPVAESEGASPVASHAQGCACEASELVVRPHS